MYVNIDVDVDEVLENLDDDEVRKLFDARFGSQSAEELWVDIYNKRRDMSLTEFIKYLDPIIMNKTGRIIP